jgi:hypothetical protein
LLLLCFVLYDYVFICEELVAVDNSSSFHGEGEKECSALLSVAEETKTAEEIAAHTQAVINLNMQELAAKYHVVATLLIWSSTVGLAVTFQDVSVVLELSGKTCALN